MLLRLCIRLSWLLGLATLASPLHGQDTLQSPWQWLGHAMGERYTPHHDVVRYTRYVAERTPHFRLIEYGKTYEGRPLLALIATSAEHAGRLEDIRRDQLRRAKLLDGPLSGAPELALVWMSYNVHGDEASGTEAALEMIYRLGDPRNAQMQQLLKQAVVIIDPCINPDGRDRFAYSTTWRMTPGVTPDVHPDAFIHAQLWPGSRTNHYRFDLNRDWAWQTQAESRARIALYQQWMPHLHADYHEMGPNSPYYFLPAAEPLHSLITPWQREFQRILGGLNARYFDQAGQLFFTQEVFDLLYPSFGDTYPIFNGAIGMTYEQGGADGTAYRTRIGDTLTLRVRVQNHVRTSLATIEASVAQRERMHREFTAYFDRAVNAPSGTYKTFVLSADNPTNRLNDLLSFLQRNGISYSVVSNASAKAPLSGFSYLTSATENYVPKVGDVVISAYQPRSVLAQVLLEPRTTLSDSVTYDITAWALPYVYGLKGYAFTTRLALPTSAEAPKPAAAELPAQPYGYLIPYQSFRETQALAQILKRGLRVRVNTKPITTGGVSYPAGTLLIARGENAAMGARFDATLRQLAAEFGLSLRALPSGQSEKGPDLGSGWIDVLKAPRVAVLTGPTIDDNAFGATWHYFEQELKYPVTVIRAEQLGRARMSDFDVLILPDGNYGSLLGGSTLDMIDAWVRAGGKLIAVEGALGSLMGKRGFELRGRSIDTTQAKLPTDPAKLPKYGDRERDGLREAVAGAIVQVRLDDSHPLAYGLGNPYFTLRNSSRAYAYLKEGWNVGWLEGKGPLSGFAGGRAKPRLADGLIFGVEPKGRGAVIYLADDPLFRCFWYSGKHLFGNAVFLLSTY